MGVFYPERRECDILWAMNPRVARPYFLVASILASLVLAFFIFKPFLVPLVLAAIFAITLQPLHQALLGRMNALPGVAASLTILIAVVCAVAPLILISTRILDDARNLYPAVVDGSARVYLDAAFERANELAARYAPNAALSGAELSASIDEQIQGALAWLIRNIGGMFGKITALILDLFIFLIALYYLLRDGGKIRRALVEASPLADAEDTFVLSRLELAVHSVIRGSLLIALIQGVLTAVGFTLAGVPNSVLWGVVAALCAFIPGFGTSLVLAPGIAYLFIIGATGPAVGLLLWGVLAVGLIDNFLGPKLVGSGMQLHPLAVLLSVFGGLAFFGPAGAFLGPLAMSLLLSLLSIYRHLSRQAVQV